MRKHFLIFIIFIMSLNAASAQNVGIGTTTPNTSAQLDISSTSKGMLIPRMTDAEKNAIVSPAPGLMVYNTNTNSFQYYNGVSWNNISHSGIVTGTANRVAKFNSPWGLTPGMITDNGAGIGINTTNAGADANSQLDITSTNKGLLIPRMTTAQKNAILTPAKGLLVFDSTINNFSFYSGTAWTDLNGGGSSNWQVLGNNIYNSNTGNVGIGASTPSAKLTVNGDAVIWTGLGIATTTPDLFSFKLDVNGNAHIQNGLAINDSYADYNLDVNGTAGIEVLGVGIVPDLSYPLKAGGTANLANLLVPGTANINGTLNANSNLAVDGTATVKNGKGVAYNASNGNNLRIFRFTTGNFHAVLGAHASATTTVAFNGGFTSTPTVVVGDIESTGGTVGELDRVILVLRGCVLDTNTGITTCTAKIINTDNASVDYNITWNCVAFGY
jgi:hypothetical protein